MYLTEYTVNDWFKLFCFFIFCFYMLLFLAMKPSTRCSTQIMLANTGSDPEKAEFPVHKYFVSHLGRSRSKIKVVGQWIKTKSPHTCVQGHRSCSHHKSWGMTCDQIASGSEGKTLAASVSPHQGQLADTCRGELVATRSLPPSPLMVAAGRPHFVRLQSEYQQRLRQPRPPR